jgi:hypothetical protein
MLLKFDYLILKAISHTSHMSLPVSETQLSWNIFLESVPRGGTSTRSCKRLQVCKQHNEVTAAPSAGITVNEFVEWISKQTRLFRYNKVRI